MTMNSAVAGQQWTPGYERQLQRKKSAERHLNMYFVHQIQFGCSDSFTGMLGCGLGEGVLVLSESK
jgi:hypothetical protein